MDGRRMCQACQEGRHEGCGMQTWCECGCDGPEGVFWGPDPNGAGVPDVWDEEAEDE